MRHDETRARSEARAEAFEEAAKWCRTVADVWCRGTTAGTQLTGREIRGLEHRFDALAATERAAHATYDLKGDVAKLRAAWATRDAPAASEGTPRRMEITDCVEDDGFTTAHVTGWPDSYPFEALDPWPDNPAEACK